MSENQLPAFEQGYHGQPASNPFAENSAEAKQYDDGVRAAKREPLLPEATPVGEAPVNETPAPQSVAPANPAPSARGKR